MSAVIETLVLCDDCGHQNNGDDRNLNATQIRARRKRAGWIQVGSKDYCDKCATNHKRAKSSNDQDHRSLREAVKPTKENYGK